MVNSDVSQTVLRFKQELSAAECLEDQGYQKPENYAKGTYVHVPKADWHPVPQ
jgi:hypothetical protein